ncbi:hypothetical protein [Uliginosibacterium sp. 31-12]|uniref:hypothetical protein n=1 Tax=Uliginosibacterium sp. 31-12 TaxID=3062781 RepID=UPI0026E2B8ED|nr:hypothetical protein [Uliginosibacterium sp. 31-12]MDO6387855.1 hypothetical protein [Uliginosibacterium sp. 31-12]
MPIIAVALALVIIAASGYLFDAYNSYCERRIGLQSSTRSSSDRAGKKTAAKPPETLEFDLALDAHEASQYQVSEISLHHFQAQNDRRLIL